MDFEQELTSLLRGIDLSARSSTKFDDASARLRVLLNVDALTIKALGDAKNFGNRISEATGAGTDALILVATANADTDAVRRAYEGRAIERIPALLVRISEAGARAELVLSAGPHPFPPGIPVTYFDAIADEPPESAPQLVRLLANLSGQPSSSLTTRLAELKSVYGDSLVHKHVGGPKNLRNRVREALGRRPAVLVTSAEQAHADGLRDALSEVANAVGAAVMIIDELGKLRVEVVSGKPEEPNDGETMYELPDDDGPRKVQEEELAYRTNRTVTDLNGYLPFDAAAGNLYEEHINTSQRLEFDTAALAFVHQLVGDPEVSMVVLTGNAGHGKTHLCRRLLSEAGARPKDAMAAMSGDLIGATPIELPGLKRRIRVLKDLSEVEPAESAAARLAELLEDTDTLAIVCANEGRLRHVASTDRGKLGLLVETLEAGIRLGATSLDPSVHVVNLNFQAVTPSQGDAFLDFSLDHWLGHGNRWRKCSSCLAAESCPILANRQMLSLGPDTRKAAEPVRESLTHLVRLAEQTGYVLTIREALIFVAFIVTGGLDCAGVHDLHKGGKLGGRGFLPAMFERRLAPNELAQLGILARIRRFDPGRIATRSIDERLHRELETTGAFGSAVVRTGSRPPSTRDQLRSEQTDHRQRIRRARREDYFNGGGDAVTRSKRLGLHHHGDFLDLQSEHIEGSRMLVILDQLVTGLHVVQGIRASGESAGVLFLVDPAFSRSANRSAVIAHQFDQRALELVGEARFWRETEGPPQLLEAVDWLDRRVVLAHRVTDDAEPSMVLDFDLMQFEFVMRAATGVVFQEFYAADRKRVVSRLAKIAEENRTSRREIRVMEGGALRRLILERDNSFRVATVG